MPGIDFPNFKAGDFIRVILYVPASIAAKHFKRFQHAESDAVTLKRSHNGLHRA